MLFETFLKGLSAFLQDQQDGGQIPEAVLRYPIYESASQGA